MPLTGVMQALLSCRDFDSQKLTIGDTSLSHTIGDAAMHSLSLAEQSWFQSMMVQWTGGDGEADAAEFINLLLRSLCISGLDFSWKKYIEVEGAPPDLFDQGGPIQPILLQLPSGAPQELTMNDLICTWEHPNGMTSALNHAADVVCIQIDRLAKDSNGQVIKLYTLVQYAGPVVLPVWTTPSQVDVKYDVVAASAPWRC